MNSADRYPLFKIILNIYVLCIENCNLKEKSFIEFFKKN